MRPSLTPVLLVVELGFLFAVAWRAARLSQGRGIRAVFVHLLWLTLYAGVTTLLGASGFYTRDAVLATLPALWLQGASFGAAVRPALLSANLRDGLRRVVDVTPAHWFAGFHALRISALGTAYKTALGEFPVWFELAVGIPDLLFGASALWVASRARRGVLGDRTFLIWNLVGVAVIVPTAPVLLQLGLPGPLHVFTSAPDARAVFTFPMSIAPLMGVPLFVLTNLLVAWRLWEKRRRS